MGDRVQEACKVLANSKLRQVVAAIRDASQSRGLSAPELFSELAGTDGLVHDECFAKFLGGLPDLGGLSHLHVPEEQRHLLLGQVLDLSHDDTDTAAFRLTRWNFLKMVQRFVVCVRGVGITEEFDINSKSCSTTRKLEPGERIEVLEGPKTDDS